MSESVAAQNLVLPVLPTIGEARVLPGHPVQVEPGQTWVWAADAWWAAEGRQVNGANHAATAFFALNGRLTGGGYVSRGSDMMMPLPNDGEQSQIGALLTIPEVDNADQSVTWVQPAVESFIATGVLLVRNLVCRRVS